MKHVGDVETASRGCFAETVSDSKLIVTVFSTCMSWMYVRYVIENMTLIVSA
jgi:hypothetical protein